MPLLSHLVRVGVGCAAILALPSLAAGQPFTLSGRLVEQFPGGGAIPAPEVQIFRVSPTGEFPSLVTSFGACEDADHHNVIHCAPTVFPDAHVKRRHSAVW